MTTTKLIVASGQYETCAAVVTVVHATERGLARRIAQLRREHSVYGDNWAGWIPARVAYATPGQDEWGRNEIIGGRWCEPARGWIEMERQD